MISLEKLIQKRRDRIQARSDRSVYGFFHRFTSITLVFLLFLSQTIHVSFFDPVEASNEDYRDIVSLIVDETTYNTLDGILSGKIQRYAKDIQ